MQSIDRSRQRLAIGAAALAGYVDAAGFLSADRYFVSFMSGNTTRLGVDLITMPSRAYVPLALILGFFLGVFAGALLAMRAKKRRKFTILALVASLLAGAAAFGAAQMIAAMMACLVVAMGALNNTFQKDGEVSVGLTYMTGAIVRTAQMLAAKVSGTGGTGWENWLLLWLGLALGAIAGAALLTVWPGMALWIAAIWASGLALAARRIAAT